MANFKAWKTYMLYLIDHLVDEHAIKGPFLDAGCGSGDVSLHFAKKGWSGTAVDFSPEVAAQTKNRLASFHHVSVQYGDLFHLNLAQVNTIFLMDVIEHVKDDDGFVKQIAANVIKGGHLVITVPVNPIEWRWDDVFYGHYRRYTHRQFRELMERNGFRVLSEWDCSFPLFWLMRRVYTRLVRKPLLFGGEQPEERTKVSTQQSAWDCSQLSVWIDAFFSITKLYLIHYPFRRGRWGCEMLMVARKDV